MGDATDHREGNRAHREMFLALEEPTYRGRLPEDALFDEPSIVRIDLRAECSRHARERERGRQGDGEPRAPAWIAKHDRRMKQRGSGQPPEVAVHAFERAKGEWRQRHGVTIACAVASTAVMYAPR